MPLYEYECTSCGTRTEVLQRVGAPPIDDCSECGGQMKRLLSAPAVQFKGTGWYVTDYADKGSVKAARSEGEAKDDSSSTAAVKSKKEGSDKKSD